jgi:hypothetical protein
MGLTEHFRMHARYNRIANERIFEACARLDDAPLLTRFGVQGFYCWDAHQPANEHYKILNLLARRYAENRRFSRSGAELLLQRVEVIVLTAQVEHSVLHDG